MIATRCLCVNLRKSEGGVEDGYFARQEREALDKLKATLAKKKKPIDERDEKVHLARLRARAHLQTKVTR